MGAYTPFRPPTKIWLSWKTPDTVIIHQHAKGPNKTVTPLQGRTLLCFINYLSTAAVVGFFSALNFISERINGLAHTLAFLGYKNVRTPRIVSIRNANVVLHLQAFDLNFCLFDLNFCLFERYVHYVT